MAKGKAGLSSSGASMSKYDVEVEGRLKALEAVAHPVPAHSGGGGDSRVDSIIAAAKQAQATDVEVDSKLDILLNAISQL